MADIPGQAGDSARVFLVDVDNTLLNNDLFQFDLQNHVAKQAGAIRRGTATGRSRNR